MATEHPQSSERGSGEEQNLPDELFRPSPEAIAEAERRIRERAEAAAGREQSVPTMTMQAHEEINVLGASVDEYGRHPIPVEGNRPKQQGVIRKAFGLIGKAARSVGKVMRVVIAGVMATTIIPAHAGLGWMWRKATGKKAPEKKK